MCVCNCVRSAKRKTRRSRPDLGCSARKKKSCSMTARPSGKARLHANQTAE